MLPCYSKSITWLHHSNYYLRLQRESWSLRIGGNLVKGQIRGVSQTTPTSYYLETCFDPLAPPVTPCAQETLMIPLTTDGTLLKSGITF